MHLMALDDLLYVEDKDHIFADMYKPIDQVLQEIKNSIDGIIEYQKTALKLVEYENKINYAYNEFHKSISKQEEKHKKDIKIPHVKCHLRNFVLYPILQIDSEWVHPLIKKNVKILINKLDQKSRIEITRLNKNVIINT